MNSKYKGKILISTPSLSNDLFSRSVVFIVEHNNDGAFGFILNKKNPNLPKSILKILGENAPINIGGPVETEKLFFLVKENASNENHLQIDEHFLLTEDFENLMNLFLENKINLDQVKIFSGYSGWSANQLEDEMERKCWLVVDHFSLEHVLNNQKTIWKDILHNLGGEYLIWANSPTDISMN